MSSRSKINVSDLNKSTQKSSRSSPKPTKSSSSKVLNKLIATVNPGAIPIKKDQILKSYLPKRAEESIDYDPTVFKIPGKPPAELSAILDDEEQYVRAYAEKIQKQKTVIDQHFSILEEEIFERIRKAKEALFTELENNWNTFRKNFADYRQLIKQHFTHSGGNPDEDPKVAISKQKILLDISNCSTDFELQEKMKSLLSQLESPNRDAEFTLLNRLRIMNNSLKLAANRFPNPKLINEDVFHQNLKIVTTCLDASLKELIEVDGVIWSVADSPIESMIVTPLEVDSLLGIITQKKKINFAFNLINRAKKDGSNLEEVVKQFLNKSNVLVLLKTHKGNVRGCFKYSNVTTETSEKTRYTLSFDLANKLTKKETSRQEFINAEGCYLLTHNMMLTFNKQKGINPMILADLKHFKSEVRPEKHICLCASYLEVPDNVVIKNKEVLEKVIVGVDEIELFEVIEK